ISGQRSSDVKSGSQKALATSTSAGSRTRCATSVLEPMSRRWRVAGPTAYWVIVVATRTTKEHAAAGSGHTRLITGTVERGAHEAGGGGEPRPPIRPGGRA